MSRFLTPSKIGLLALASLYADSVVPSAAVVPILSFFASNLLTPTGYTAAVDIHEKANFIAIPIKQFQNATIGHASGVPGRTLWDLLLKKLWDLNSLDAMHVFFKSLALLLKTLPEGGPRDDDVEDTGGMRFSVNAPLGHFVRRAYLEFERLQIQDGVTLWKGFVAYRSPTLPMWRRRNPGAGKFSVDTHLADERPGKDEKLFAILYGDVDAGSPRTAFASTYDVQALMEFQTNQMQKMGVRVPRSMRKDLDDMIRAGAAVPSVSHYVRLLDSWKSGDYPSAFDHLHRYFDYTIQTGDRTFHQYALLTLAILYKDFGCLTEAISAMEETISTARVNQDVGCLTYSLSWLHQLGKAYPEGMDEIQKIGALGTDEEALAFLEEKSAESGYKVLLSNTLLNKAWAIMTKGECLGSAFERITEVSCLNLKNRTHAAIGGEMGIQSSMFSRLGLGAVGWFYDERLLECYADTSPAEDILNALYRKVTALALKGRYDEAFGEIDGVSDRVIHMLNHQQLWTSQLTVLKLRRSIHRDHLEAAGHYLSQLQSRRQPDQDVVFAVRWLEINLQIRRQNYTQAIDRVDKHVAELYNQDADVFKQIKLMILKSHIYNKAGIPQKGFSIAIRAASLAFSTRLLAALWDAVCALCNVLNSLTEFEAAVKILKSVVPRVLECEDCELVANSFSCLADAHMGLAGQTVTDPSMRKEHMVKALEYLGKSFDEFSMIGDVQGQCETLAKKATIMRLNGDRELASDYTTKCLDIRKAAKAEAP